MFLFGYTQQRIIRSLRLDLFRNLLQQVLSPASPVQTCVPHFFWYKYCVPGARPGTKSLIGMYQARLLVLSVSLQEVSYYDTTSTGNISSRLTSDTAEMANDLTWYGLGSGLMSGCHTAGVPFP